jgi:transcriptional regulator with XRE-family HTH domain
MIEELEGIGARLRAERARIGLSQRELARRLGVSPSLISQIESGQSKPSVGTLYAIVTELGLSLDRVIRGTTFDERGGSGTSGDDSDPVVHPGGRTTVELESGVRWERLTCDSEGEVTFVEAVYEVGGASTPDESLMRHHGREYGYVVSGTLGIQVGFEKYELAPGDSISFDSTRPHRLFNAGRAPVHAIWVVIDRGADDGVGSSGG